MNCGTCRWFRPLSDYSPPGACLNPINDHVHLGAVVGGAVRMARVVDRRHDWCGEFHAADSALPAPWQPDQWLGFGKVD